MKTKLYLLFLLFTIMGTGARAMFRIAYNGMAKEHGSAPDGETTTLMLLTVWLILMMVADVLLLNYKAITRRNLYIALLSVGVFAPAIYILVTL